MDQIPFEDEYFDAIVCLAVLEHVQNPVDIVKEFFRVLKLSGLVIASVPFLQPEHKILTDYQRYTKDGLYNLFFKNKFEVKEIKPIFTLYHTIYWIVWE